MISELLSRVEGYLSGQLSLRDLEDWLLVSLDDILEGGEEAAIAAANQLDVALIHLHDGQVDEAEFRRALVSMINLQGTLFVHPDPATMLRTGTSSTATIRRCYQGPVPQTIDYRWQVAVG